MRRRVESVAASRPRYVWATLGAIFIALVMFVSGTRVESAHAALPTEELIVEIQPSSSDAALWSLIRQTLATVDPDVMETDNDPALADFKAAYGSLRQLLSEADHERSFFKLTAVPTSLAKAFDRGSLPQAALFSAAGEVNVVGEDEAARPGVNRVTSASNMVESAKVFSGVEAFKTAYNSLDEADRILVSGNVSTLENLSEADLEKIADHSGEKAAAARLQLDRRLAANFPDMSSYSNGLLPPETLCPIPWDTRYQLHCSTIGNFSRLNEAYKAEFGTDMPILSGYRPLSDQYAVNESSPNMTAIPGTSNHGWGLAVDFDWDVFDSWDDPEVKWMIENGPRYGWRHPSALNWKTDRPEPWHYEFGTMYGGSESEDFDGPVPDVVYHVKAFG